MAKYLKSFFQTSEKRSTRGFEGGDEDRDAAPPLDGRRKLSISRSGRMKQNKKRHSLTLDLYGDNIPSPERAASKEYHVHGRTFTNESCANHDRKSPDDIKCQTVNNEEENKQIDVKTPEEEIDNAFQILDKT